MAAPVYPPPTPGVLRVTQSSLETYLRCGIRWEFEREAKVRFATVRMLIGSAVSAGAKTDNDAKLSRGVPATLSAIVESAVADYEEEAAGAEIPDPKPEIARGKDDAAAAARAFGEQVSPKLDRVLMAEKPLLARLRGIELAGTPDVVTEEGIGDEKTGQPWTQARTDRSRQLSLYGLLHRVHIGRFPRRLWIDSLSCGRRGWIAERIWTSRTPEDYTAVLSIVETASKAMALGVTLPAPEGAWWCDPKWCPHWRRCPAVGRG